MAMIIKGKRDQHEKMANKTRPPLSPSQVMKLLSRNIIAVLVLALCSVTVVTASAKNPNTNPPRSVQPARIFGSHMVLQCDRPIKIWGTAPAKQPIAVSLDQDVRETEADAAGDWSVTFPARKASLRPIILKINKVRYDNILIGEVWICAGQSNMAFPLKNAAGSKILGNQMTNDHLRLCVHRSIPITKPNGYTKGELARCNVDKYFGKRWTSSDPQTANSTSAVGWIFGNGLQKKLNVPVGIIQVAVGGSAINNWIPSEAARKHPLTATLYEKDWLSNNEVSIYHRNRAKDAFKEVLEKGKPYIVGKTPYRWICEPDFIFEAGIAPLKGLGFRGMVWYQGETDAQDEAAVSRASELFPFLIKSWRSYFEAGDFPFVFVQLPGYKVESWPQFREVQRMAAVNVPNTAMAVTIDLGAKNDIHPRDKFPVGERVLGLALKHAYGKKDIVSFPAVSRIDRTGENIVITFRECGSGFLPVKGNIPGFELADKTGTFHAAKASISAPNEVTVVAPVPNPVKLRYGWQPFPEPRLVLFNDMKLPLGPFLTSIDMESNKPDASNGK